MQVRFGWAWLPAAALLALAGCGDDDDDDDSIGGEGEMDSVLDVLVDGAEGVLAGVQSVRASYLVSGSTSCDGLIDVDDTGCANPADASEDTLAYQCDDGVDNDDDGFADYRTDGGGDAQCSSPTDATE